MDKENVNFTITTQKLRRDAYLTEKSGWNAQHRAHSQDDEGEFPAFDEADDEGCDEGGVSLDQHSRLVTNTLLDLIDITAHANVNTLSTSEYIYILQKELKQLCEKSVTLFILISKFYL